MTENTMATSFDEEDGGDRKKTLMIVGGVAGALVLGGAGFMLLHGGSSADESFAVPRHTVTTKGAVKTNAAPATKATKQLPAASTVRLGRDPFNALYLVPVAAPATAPSTPAKAPTTPPATGGTSGTPSTGTAEPVATTYPLKLTKVYGTASERTAVFTVSGKTQLAKVGSVFGKTSELKLLSLQQGAKGAWIAVVQVGDADPVDLNMGATILVM